jgi:dTDP-4-dehydrorhamnose reductase
VQKTRSENRSPTRIRSNENAGRIRLKLLITGANGQLGLALTRQFSSSNNSNTVVALNRAALNIADDASCEQALNVHQPDVVLNCAAYTAVDRAETERDLAFAINETGAANLARHCKRIGALLVHFSTDYVFDGSGCSPYVETDPVAPLGAYGASKLAGERAIAASSNDYLIFRLSWVYSNDGANFYKTMLRLAEERDVLRVVADQFGTPNFTGDLANAIAQVLSFSREALRERAGVYHLSAQGVTQWHAFASEIIASAQLARRPRVEPITTADFPTPAKRPAFSALNSSRFMATFRHEMPTWQSGLQRCLAERGVSA